MVFSSFEFLFRFLPVFLLVYYMTPQKWKNERIIGSFIAVGALLNFNKVANAVEVMFVALV